MGLRPSYWGHFYLRGQFFKVSIYNPILANFLRHFGAFMILCYSISLCGQMKLLSGYLWLTVWEITIKKKDKEQEMLEVEKGSVRLTQEASWEKQSLHTMVICELHSGDEIISQGNSHSAWGAFVAVLLFYYFILRERAFSAFVLSIFEQYI